MTNQQPIPLLEGATAIDAAHDKVKVAADRLDEALEALNLDRICHTAETLLEALAGEAVARAAAPDLARENAELRQRVEELTSTVADAAKMFKAIIPMTTADLLKNSETGEIGPALLVIAESAAQCAASMHTALAQASEPTP